MSDATTRTRRFRVTLSDGEDGWLVIECPDLPGCVSQGRTIKEAVENIRDAITGWLEVREGQEPRRVEVDPIGSSAVVQ